MQLTGALVLTLAGLSIAHPALSPRGGNSSIWNDSTTPQPINFHAYRATDRCSVQLVYERYSADKKYHVQYDAAYSDSSRALIKPKTGSLVLDNMYIVDGLTDNRAYQTAFFEGICKSGSAPVSLSATFAPVVSNTSLPTSLSSNWTTGSVEILNATLPSAVQYLTFQRRAHNTLLAWSGTEGAQGYILLMEYSSVDAGTGRNTSVVVAHEFFEDRRDLAFSQYISRAAVFAVGENNVFGPLNEATDVDKDWYSPS